MRPEAKREAAVRANEEMQKIAIYEKAVDTEGAVAEYKDVEMEDVEEGTDDKGAFAAQVQVQVQVSPVKASPAQARAKASPASDLVKRRASPASRADTRRCA